MMANEFKLSENVDYTRLQVQMELLGALLAPKHAPYFWNTAAPKSEAHFVEAEQEFMANELNRSEDVDYTPWSKQIELLEALLEPEDAPYPWNTAAPESEAYFVEAEQQFMVEDCLEQEIAARSQAFFTQLDQLWEATKPAADQPERIQRLRKGERVVFFGD